MNDAGITRRYVRALFELTFEEEGAGGLEAAKRILSDLQWFSSLLDEETLGSFLADPRQSAKAKKEALEKVLPEELQARSRDFLLWITERGRAELLPLVSAEFEQLLLDREGVQRAEVTTVHRLDPEAHALLQAQLEKQTGKKVQLVGKVDPEILGGLRVKFGSSLFDGSLRRELDELRRDLLNTRLPEPVTAALELKDEDPSDG